MLNCYHIGTNEVIFIKYGWNTIVWAIHASEALRLKFIRSQNLYQLLNLQSLSTFQGQKNPHGQNLIFLNLKCRVI